MGSQTRCQHQDLCTVVLRGPPLTMREEQNITNPDTNISSIDKDVKAATHHLERFELRDPAGF